MCDRITLDELLDEDRLEYEEYSLGFFRDRVWHTGHPTGRRVPTEAGQKILEFVRRYLSIEEQS